MDRHELLDWMDAVADNWPWGRHFDQQIFIGLWWRDLHCALQQECLDYCPTEVARRKAGRV